MFGNKFEPLVRKYATNKLVVALAITGAVAAAGLGGLGISHLVHRHDNAISHVNPAQTAPKSSQRADGPGLGGGYADGPGLGGGYACLLADGPGGSGY